MKFATLVWKNATRNKRRTVLTALSLATSLFLLTTLRTVLSELQAVSVAPQSDLRLVTRHAVSFTNPLPIAYLNRIERIQGVRAVTPGNWFAGIYIDEKNFFGQFTADPEKMSVVFPEIAFPEEQREAFRKQRNAAIAGTRLFGRFGWKIGDRITLRGTNYPADLEFVLVGRFTSPNPPDEAAMIFRWDYLDEAVGRLGQAGWYTILAESREDMPRIMQSIDEMFRSSGAPTKTESEKEFQLSFSGILGNVKFLVTSISTVVIFTLLLVTTTTMSMNIRERTGELGLLQAVGFPRSLIFRLFLAEAILTAISGWVLGCVGAWILYSNLDLQQATGGWFTLLRVQPGTIGLGFALSIIIALFASGMPAYRAVRRSIADALRYVG